MSSSNNNNTRRPSVLSAEDYPSTLIRSQSSSSEVSLGRTASGGSNSGGIPNSKTMNNRTSTLAKQHPAVPSTAITLSEAPKNCTTKIECAEADASSTIETIASSGIITPAELNQGEETARICQQQLTIAFDDRGEQRVIINSSEAENASTSVSNKKQSTCEENDSSTTTTESKSSSASSTKAKYGEQNTGTSAGPALQQKVGVGIYNANHPAVAFDPSTNEFTYLITVPRQLVDIHNVASVVRTTGEAARLKHLLQYVADRYAPLQPLHPPTMSNHQGSSSQQQPIPLLIASNSACLQHTGNVTVEIALTEAAIIDKSIYAAHERRQVPMQQQQMNNNNIGRI